MGVRGSRWLLVLGLLAACEGDPAILGDQCPNPGARGSSLARDAGSSNVFGTSCAPCKPTRYDEQGCPIYVTWASCGGDICIGSRVIPVPRGDAGPGDGGSGDEDAGASDEDASTGARP